MDSIKLEDQSPFRAKSPEEALKLLYTLPERINRTKSSDCAGYYFLCLIDSELKLGRFGPALERVELAKNEKKLRGFISGAYAKIGDAYQDDKGNISASIKCFMKAREYSINKNAREYFEKCLADLLRL